MLPLLEEKDSKSSCSFTTVGQSVAGAKIKSKLSSFNPLTVGQVTGCTQEASHTYCISIS